MNDEEWKIYAKNLLKAELTRHGVNYESLVDKLNAMGIDETYHSVNNKINRGTFNFVFVLQCLKAVGANHFRL